MCTLCRQKHPLCFQQIRFTQSSPESFVLYNSRQNVEMPLIIYIVTTLGFNGYSCCLLFYPD